MDLYIDSLTYYNDQNDLKETARQWTSILNLRNKQQLQAILQDNKNEKIFNFAFPGYVLETDPDNEFIFIRQIESGKRRPICMYPGCRQLPILGEGWSCNEHHYWMNTSSREEESLVNGIVGRKRVRFQDLRSSPDSSASTFSRVANNTPPGRVQRNQKCNTSTLPVGSQLIPPSQTSSLSINAVSCRESSPDMFVVGF